MRLGLLFSLVLASLALLTSVAVAAPADLDRGFGDDGIAQVPGPQGSVPGESGGRMAIGPRDEIYVLYSDYPAVCEPWLECPVRLSLARFEADGSRDRSFETATDLVVTQNPYQRYFDLAVGPDGKPVVAAIRGSAGLVVARFGLDGRLDPTFGKGGIAATASGHPVQLAGDIPKVAVQADGKVVVAVDGGRQGSGHKLLVARYLADGRFDPTFAGDGEATVLLKSSARPAGLFVAPGGELTVPAPLCCLGGSGSNKAEGYSLARLEGGGALDLSWSSRGDFFFPTPGFQSDVEAAAPTAEGGLFISLESSTEQRSTVGNVVKLDAAGRPDRSFGNGGQLWLYPRVGSISLKDLAVDGRQRLVGAGWAGQLAVFRLRPDGSRDRTFNGGERTLLPYGGNGSPEYQVGIQSSGRIIAFGDSGIGNSRRFGLLALRGGNDRSTCMGRRATIVGTAKADKLVGTPHRDVIAALGGRDEVRALGGDDLVCGGRGADLLFGGAGRDQVR